MKKNKVTILPPDINSSFPNFSVESDGAIRFGFNAIKSTTTAVIEKLVEEREKNGPYTSFRDVFERNKGSLNKPTAMSLIKAGAFDSLEPNRAKLVASRDLFLDYTKKLKKKEESESDIGVLGDMSSLLGIEAPVKKKSKRKPVEIIIPELIDTPEWDQLSKANAEKTAFGYYLTVNPYRSHFLKILGGFEAATPIAELNGQFQEEGKSDFLIGGLVEEVFQFRGKNMGRITLNDGSGSFGVTVFEQEWLANKQEFKANKFLSMKVRLQERMNPKSGDFEISSIANSIHNFTDIRNRTVSTLFVGSELDDELIRKFTDLCGKHAGSQEDRDPTAVLCVPNENGRKTVRHSQYFLKVSEEALNDFKEVFGENNVIATFKKDLDNIVFPVVNKGNGKGYSKDRYNQSNNQKRKGFSN